MSEKPLFAQVKLHPYFGGGEVFASHLAEAAAALGGSSVLIIRSGVKHWADLHLPNTQLIEVRDWDEAVERLPAGLPVIMHAAPPLYLVRRMREKQHPLIGFVHMPLNRFYAETSQSYALCRQVVGVSHYVMDTIRMLGLRPWGEPFYGVAEVRRPCEGGGVIRGSEFEWDQRKFRDRVLGLTEPLWSRFRPRRAYTKRVGLTIGIVSRLAPIKQFPLLIELLVADLLQHEGIHLEIFGSGGYGSVRDLRRALRPLGKRVRFWGHQRDIAEVYSSIDILLTGLPEREALGLNVIEAQASGVPVLAPGAPPFTETVLIGKTGWLYADPRQKDLASIYPTFSEVLATILKQKEANTLPDPRLATEHMEKFSKHAFSQRLAELLASCENRPDG